MNRFLLLLILVFAVPTTDVRAQSEPSLEGAWHDRVSIGPAELAINLHLTRGENNLWTSAMDSPDQGAFGIPASETEVGNGKVRSVFSAIGLSIEVEYNPTTECLEGNMLQAGMTFPVSLKRGVAEKKIRPRPQTPAPPFPYESEEVVFRNDTIPLAGTLTYPRGGKNLTAVVLITGSGPQDRDETIEDHRPFAVLADYLSRRGIAVLRYDDRGVAGSGGDFQGATSLDFSKDAEAGWQFLRTRPEINPQRIGYLGHSEGGMVAAMAAARNPETAFVISLAGTALPGTEILRIQTELIAMAEGTPPAAARASAEENQALFRMAMEAGSPEAAEAALRKHFAANPSPMGEPMTEQSIRIIADPWFLFFLHYDPATDWKKVRCPILALNGSLDLQVTPENLAAIANAAFEGGNEAITTITLHGLNHLFQRTETGRVSEYGQIEHTMDEPVLEIVGEWLGRNVD